MKMFKNEPKCKINSDTWLLAFGLALAILLRLCTTLHPYSGQGNPPMYGDYEAQRHWMEITINLPLKEWYQNSTDNDLMYWGLDYPPLSAYHMYACGIVAKFLNSNYTKLHDSRGYESEEHKLFMRLTVLLADSIVFIPTLVIYYYTCTKAKSPQTALKGKLEKAKNFNQAKPLTPSLSSVLGLLYPGIILIDHGHFQYNCLSLGLTTAAIIAILKKHNLIASFLFCLALNYKQMELYHALPFFFYLLSICVPKPGQSTMSGLINLTKIAMTVVITFLVIWSPFIFDLDTLIQVLKRQFPFSRGIFEDKVSNVWCFLNIFYKLKQLSHDNMMRICLFTTVTAVLPSSVDLFLRPNLRKFVLANINSALAFFLFSYQVHEKTILVAALPVLLYFPFAPFICFWFLSISVFSMTPLFIKDGLVIAVIALEVMYFVVFQKSIEHAYKSSLNCNDGFVEYYKSLFYSILDIEYCKNSRFDLKTLYREVVKNKDALKVLLFHLIMICSLVGCLVLFVLSLTVAPPKHYPHLFPLLCSVYSCLHFIGFFLYFNVKQLSISQEFESVSVLKKDM